MGAIPPDDDHPPQPRFGAAAASWNRPELVDLNQAPWKGRIVRLQEREPALCLVVVRESVSTTLPAASMILAGGGVVGAMTKRITATFGAGGAGSLTEALMTSTTVNGVLSFDVLTFGDFIAELRLESLGAVAGGYDAVLADA